MYLLKPAFIIVYRFHHLWKSESILIIRVSLKLKFLLLRKLLLK